MIFLSNWMYLSDNMKNGAFWFFEKKTCATDFMLSGTFRRQASYLAYCFSLKINVLDLFYKLEVK